MNGDTGKHGLPSWAQPKPTEPSPSPSPSEGTDGDETGLGGGDPNGEHDAEIDGATEIGLDDASSEGVFDPATALETPPDEVRSSEGDDDAQDGLRGALLGDESDDLGSEADLDDSLADDSPAGDALAADDDLDLELDSVLAGDAGEEGLAAEEEPLDALPARERGEGEDAEEGEDALFFDVGLGADALGTEGAGPGAPAEALRWEDRAWQWTLGPVRPVHAALGGITALRVIAEGALVDSARGPLLITPEGRVERAPTREEADDLGAEHDLGDFALEGERLVRRRGVGESPVVTLTGVLRAAPTPDGGVFACVYDEAQERVLLVRVDPAADTAARIVGDVSGDLAARAPEGSEDGGVPEALDDPAPAAIASGIRVAFDPARGWVWLAGTFGVAAYRR